VVSSTAQTWRRRRIKEKRAGRHNKKSSGTPAFPVHPEGYDPSAADAKKPEAGSSG
jgi:hypothetical protein